MLRLIPISGCYAGLLALLFLILSWNVVRQRMRYRVARGDGGEDALARGIRAHGNFSEYVPLALILLAILELNGAGAWLLHLLGSTLLVSRALHGWGLARCSGVSFGRYYGTVGTFAVLLILAAFNLYLGLF